MSGDFKHSVEWFGREEAEKFFTFELKTSGLTWASWLQRSRRCCYVVFGKAVLGQTCIELRQSQCKKNNIPQFNNFGFVTICAIIIAIELVLRLFVTNNRPYFVGNKRAETSFGLCGRCDKLLIVAANKEDASLRFELDGSLLTLLNELNIFIYFATHAWQLSFLVLLATVWLSRGLGTRRSDSLPR